MNQPNVTRTGTDPDFDYTVSVNANATHAEISIRLAIRPVTVTEDGETLAPEPLAHAEDVLEFAGELYEEVLDDLRLDPAGDVWARLL